MAYGLVHLLIAWLALELALGHYRGKPSSQGALHQLAKEPFGGVLIWAVAVGMAALVLWRLLEAGFGHRDAKDEKRAFKRAGSLGKAVFYGAVGVSALKVAIGAGSNSHGRPLTAKLMDLPAGTWIVGLVGVAVIAYGANYIRRGLAEKFRDNLSAEGKTGDAGAAYLLLGKVGYVAKGIAIGLVGALFGYAALAHDPNESTGLDAALRKVLEQPFGPVMLGLVAAGIGCYGLFCFARARHLAK